MNKVIVLVAIVLLIAIRWLLLTLHRKDAGHLIISFFILTIPFSISFPLIGLTYDTMAGTMGVKIYLMIPLMLSMLLIPRYLFIKKKPDTTSKWLIAILILTAISFINPVNEAKAATMVFVVFFFSHILFFYLISNLLTKEQIITGIFEGLQFLCIINFILAICFPVLGIKFVTTFFHETGERGATRMGSRPGAIGAYSHPGHLALFTIIATIFFLASFLNDYKKSIARILIIINLITLVLTFSRTAYMAFIIDVIIVVFIYKNSHKPLFSLKNVLKVGLPTTLILGWLIFFSPFSDTFLKSDATEQFDNRMIHWTMAYETFKVSPIFGVGINTHLEFFSDQFSIFKSMLILDPFFWENPIHNTHLIMLVETGIVGFVLWWVFIFQSIAKAKDDMSYQKNRILGMTHIGLILAYIFYGITGWATFSMSMLPFLLLITYFTIKFRGTF